MKKLFLLSLLVAALVAFVGVDAVKGALTRARSDLRDALTANVPLETRLAEARALVDAYAESVIRGEVAAEGLDTTIAAVAREVKGLEARVGREREDLAALRQGLEVVPVGGRPSEAEREALRRARAFEATAERLLRRQDDLVRLREEREATAETLAEAKAEQARLTEEVRTLAAEIESLEARTAAARTREAVGDARVSASGYAAAVERLDAIRAAVKERNRLLAYYRVERPVSETAAVTAGDDARAALDAALAAHPAR